MKQNVRVSAAKESIAAALGLSALSGVIATIILAAILAFLMNSEKISENAIGYAGMGILMAASFIGSATAEMKYNGNRLLIAASSGGIYFLILIGVTALFFEGNYHGVLVNALMILCGSSIAVILKKPSQRAGKGRSVQKRSSKVVQKRYVGK